MVERVKLRGHHLLCLQAFRGFGYGPEFISKARTIVKSLLNNPVDLDIVEGCDDLCRSCPNCIDGECRAHGSGSEASVRSRDRLILSLLGLNLGPSSWSRVLEATSKKRIRPGACEACLNCQWRNLCLTV